MLEATPRGLKHTFIDYTVAHLRTRGSRSAGVLRQYIWTRSRCVSSKMARPCVHRGPGALARPCVRGNRGPGAFLLVRVSSPQKDPGRKPDRVSMGPGAFGSSVCPLQVNPGLWDNRIPICRRCFSEAVIPKSIVGRHLVVQNIPLMLPRWAAGIASSVFRPVFYLSVVLTCECIMYVFHKFLHHYNHNIQIL